EHGAGRGDLEGVDAGIVEGEAVGRERGGERVVSAGRQAHEQRHEAAAAGGELVDDGVGGGHVASDREGHADAGRGGVAEVGDLGEQADGPAGDGGGGVGPEAGEGEVGAGGAGGGVDDGADFGLLGELGADGGELAPAGGLVVGEEVDFAAALDVAQGFEGGVEGGLEVGAAVAEAGELDVAAHEGDVGRGAGDGRGVAVVREEERGGGIGGEGGEEIEGLGAGGLEAGLHAV